MKNLLSLTFTLISFISLSQCPASISGSCDGSGTSLDLYWIGTDIDNNGDWNSPCSWRVGSLVGNEPCQAPRSNDNVFFTDASFTGGVPTITINTQAICNNFYVDPTVNTIGVTPIFYLENPGFMEIYGNFTLQTNLIWTVVGGNNSGPELLFKATTPNHTITTAGHTMGAVQFDGIGGEWALQDNYDGGSINFAFGYLNTSDGTNDYNMKLFTFDSDVQPGGSSANRKFDLNSSTIELTAAGGSFYDRYPYNTTNAPYTVWECRGTSTSNFNFNAMTSKIIFSANQPFLRLGGISYNVIQHTGTGRFYDHFGPQPCLIDTLETNGYLYFHHEHTFNVLKINSVSKTHNFFRNQEITGDFIISGDLCNPTVLKSEYNKILTMPSSVSADPMTGFLINNLKCSDMTAGHVVSGSASGNTSGWIITPPAARDLYWVSGVGATGNWSNPTNWSTTSDGLSLLGALDCPPTQTDNVFFISPLADGDNIVLDQEAYCHNQTWNITNAATLSGNKILNIFGDLTFDVDMILANTNRIDFWGATANTIFSAGKTFPSTSYFWDNSTYTLLDDLNFTNIYFYQQTSFSAGTNNLTGSRLTFRGAGTLDFSNSQILLSNSIPWYLAGSQGTITYDVNSHVTFTNTGTETHIYGWGGHPHLPSFTLQSSATTLRFRDHLKNRNVLFEGNVTLNGSARFRGDYLNGTSHGALASITINGDLNLSSGKSYIFSVTNASTISGNLNAIGLCSDYISIEGYNGNQFDLNIGGIGNFDYCNLADINSINAENATNSLDLGNNTNITFPVGASSTYYWRALSGSCSGSCNYNGDWASTSGYWTTSPANVEGVAGCIPGPYDNIVFDNMSFSGVNSNISISSTVSCHNITFDNTKITLTGNGNLKVTGSILNLNTNTLVASAFNGQLDFVSTSNETIDFNGINLGCDVNFSNSLGSWTIMNNPFSTTKTLTLLKGTLNTNGETINTNIFNSNNSSTRVLNLGSSIMNINGSGNFISTTSPTNSYTWNTDNVTNFTITPGTSTINFTSGSELTIKSSALNLFHVNFTNTSSAVNSSPVLLINNWQTEYMKFYGSARIYGNNSFDTLEFSAGKTYKIESGSQQTFNAPNGILIATGTAGNEIAIRATITGSASTFHKLNTAGTMSSFCFDYISVEDNFASSDDAIFKFYTGLNSNDISASGIWDFTRPIFVTPSITSAPDQNNCGSNAYTITWNLTGSGPYKLTYTENGINPVTVSIADGTPSYSTTVSPSVDTEYLITAFTADNCGVNTIGTVIDNNQWVYLPTPSPIAQDSDSAYCTLNNEATLISFHESPNVTERPLVSISDDATGSGLGNVSATIKIDATVQTLNGVPYLQRRFGITPTNNESATIRLYFTQAELDALSTAWGTVLTPSDLSVTKFSNDNMTFSGASSVHQPVSSGAIPAGITTSANILYVEISIPSFSHFVLHPNSNSPLPVELLSFTAEPYGQNEIITKWTTLSEINSDYFIVERSIDGLIWDKVNTLKSAGNSSSQLEYSLIDKRAIKGTSYYRLTQVDLDGEYKIYDPIKVELTAPISALIYPNPTSQNTTLRIQSKQNHESISIEIINVMGQVMSQNISNISIGTNSIKLKTDEFLPGIYFVRLTDSKSGKEIITGLKLSIK